MSFSSALFDSQLLLLFKGHAEINKLVGDYESDSTRFLEILKMIQKIVEQNKKDLSHERCFMLTRFILENINTKVVSSYVLDRICSNSIMFQKYEKLFLNYVVRNWYSLG